MKQLSRHYRRFLGIGAYLGFALASVSPVGPLVLTGCVTVPRLSVGIDQAIAAGSAPGLLIRAENEVIEVLLGDPMTLSWMVPNQGGQWILHKGYGYLAHVDPTGHRIALATSSGSHQVTLSGVVGVSLGRSTQRNPRRQRAGWVGAGIVAAGIAVSVTTGDSFGGFIALLLSPVTVPTGAAIGTLVSAAFLEGNQVLPMYLIDEGHYQIEVVRP